MSQILDAQGNVIYHLNDTGSEIQVLSANGQLMYRYVKASNQTLDSSGNLVMRGNIILGLR